MELGNTRQASYGAAEGVTVQDQTNKIAARLLTKLRAGETDLQPYGRSERTAITYTLAAGPPSSVLTLIGDLDEDGEFMAWGGVYEYGEPSGAAAVQFGAHDAQEFYEALERQS